jgi:selenocysteine lyase/cysteine desulfurase
MLVRRTAHDDGARFLTEIDVERARAETPGCSSVLHFDNAGAALMPEPVLRAMIDHIQLEAREGGYRAAEVAEDAVAHVYETAARLIGSSTDEIAVVENATRAWDVAFYALPLAKGDRILTGMAEYVSNYVAMRQVAERTGAVVEAIPDDDDGQISVAALRDAIDERVKLIALTHVPSTGGLVNPAEAVGRVATEAGIPYLLDACQSVGQMPIDVDWIGCDMLTATSRKYLRGPRGMGFLYVRRTMIEQLEPPFLDIRAIQWEQWVSRTQYQVAPTARRFENWETNYAAKIAMGVAIDYALEWGLKATWARVKELGRSLREALATIREVTLRDRGRELCGIVSFTIENREPSEIADLLARQAINVTAAPGFVTPFDLEARGLRSGVVRASVHYYNTDQEVERFCNTLAALV